MTSPYDFYQYWLNDDDELVAPAPALADAEDARTRSTRSRSEHAKAPEKRPAAARAGLRPDRPSARQARRPSARCKVADAAFSGAPITTRRCSTCSTRGRPLRLRWRRGRCADPGRGQRLVTSRQKARADDPQGGLSINGQRVAGPDSAVPEPVAGRWLVLRVGKKRLVIGRRRG